MDPSGRNSVQMDVRGVPHRAAAVPASATTGTPTTGVITRDEWSVAVSRPGVTDVVRVDLAPGAIRWRFPMEGCCAREDPGLTYDGQPTVDHRDGW
jgi:hypothetical protein